MSDDNLWVFSSSHDSKLKMYSLEMMEMRNFESEQRLNISCCYSMPDNKTVIVGSKDHSLCTYNIEFCSKYLLDEAHRDAISCLDWNRGVLATGNSILKIQGQNLETDHSS